jgi:TonB family protein
MLAERDPAYTDEARSAGVTGIVSVLFQITESGDVKDVRIVKDLPLLGAVTREAVRRWKFEPVVLEGRPVSVIVRQAFLYKLEDGQSLSKQEKAPSHQEGGLPREDIQRVIRAHYREIRDCYERELAKNSSLEGKLVVGFTILPSGLVDRAELRRSDVHNDNLEKCVLSNVSRWQFPKPPGGAPVIVGYPYCFKRIDAPPNGIRHQDSCRLTEQ